MKDIDFGFVFMIGSVLAGMMGYAIMPNLLLLSLLAFPGMAIIILSNDELIQNRVYKILKLKR